MDLKPVRVGTMGTVQPCQIRGCKKDGLWKPVVTLPYDGGREATAELDVRICTLHKNSLGDGQFVAIVYPSFVSRIRSMGLEPPPESAGKVRWDKWHLGVIILDS